MADGHHAPVLRFAADERFRLPAFHAECAQIIRVSIKRKADRARHFGVAAEAQKFRVVVRCRQFEAEAGRANRRVGGGGQGGDAAGTHGVPPSGIPAFWDNSRRNIQLSIQ